jgi:hypothetical protein
VRWRSQKERYLWRSPDVDGWIILEWISEIEWDGMDWVDLVQDRDQWKAFVNTVMNLRVS